MIKTSFAQFVGEGSYGRRNSQIWELVLAVSWKCSIAVRNLQISVSHVVRLARTLLSPTGMCFFFIIVKGWGKLDFLVRISHCIHTRTRPPWLFPMSSDPVREHVCCDPHTYWHSWSESIEVNSTLRAMPTQQLFEECYVRENEKRNVLEENLNATQQIRPRQFVNMIVVICAWTRQC
jgi:hypothetical protein